MSVPTGFRLLLVPVALLASLTVRAQRTALGQLESWAGQRISSVNVPAPSAPSGTSGTYRLPFSKTPEQKLAEAGEHYEKARRAMNSRDWEEAVRLLKKAVRKAPHSSLYAQKLKEAENNLENERNASRAYQEQRKKALLEERQREEAARRAEAEREEALKREEAALRDKIDEAGKAIRVFKQDIRDARLRMRNLSKALANNAGELNKWSEEMDQSMDIIMKNAVPFIGSIYMKYCFMDMLRPEVKQELFSKLARLAGNGNPAVQKWLIEESKVAGIDVSRTQDWIDRFNLGLDMTAYLQQVWQGNAKDIKADLESLLFLHGLLEASKITSYENLVKKGYILGIKDPSQVLPGGMKPIPRMPGDYFELAKIIGVSYTHLGVIVYSWKQVRQTGTNSDDLYNQVQLLAAGIEQREREIECLEKCMKRYSPGCLEKCTGKTALSKPPPPLLFENRNW